MSQLSKLIRFGQDVNAERKRVTWPSWPETQRLTFMVVILAVIVGVYLALVDTAIGALLAALFDINY